MSFEYTGWLRCQVPHSRTDSFDFALISLFKIAFYSRWAKRNTVDERYRWTRVSTLISIDPGNAKRVTAATALSDNYAFCCASIS